MRPIKTASTSEINRRTLARWLRDGETVRVYITLRAREMRREAHIRDMLDEMQALISDLSADVVEAPHVDGRSVTATIRSGAEPAGAGVRVPRRPLVPVLSGAAATERPLA